MIDLADGRLLLLPSGRGGRAYVIHSYEHGQRLETRLKRAIWISEGLLVAVIVAGWRLQNWYTLLFLPVPLFAPVLARQFAVSDLPEATDFVARRETAPSDEGESAAFSAVGMAAAAVAIAIFWAFRRSNPRLTEVIQVVFMTLALVGAIFGFQRRRRAARDNEIFRVTGSPDDTPIVPR